MHKIQLKANLIAYKNWTLCIVIFSLFICSCGNGSGDNSAFVPNDSLPADINAINAKINEDRNNPDLYFERAKAYFNHKDVATAINDMKIVLNIDSTKADYYIFLSDLHFTQNQTRETRDMLRKAIKLDTGNASALMKYSQLFYLLRKYDTAIFYINRSLHFDRANSVAHFQKGMILKEAGDTAKAIQGFQSAVEFNPQYFDAYMQLGVLYSVIKNPLAIEYFNTAIKFSPKSVEALYGKGKFFQNVGDYPNALSAYENLLAIAPDNLDATFNIGAIYHEQKKYEDALRMFESTIQRDENFFRGYYGRGRCLASMGERQKAIDDYRHCLAIKPDYSLAARQLDFIQKKK